MAAVNKDQALDLLAHAIPEKFGADELLEVYNEVFPDDPYTDQEALDDSAPLVEQLVKHIKSGLEIEEVIDLWGLILLKDRNVWYDDEEERIHYNEEAEAVSSA